MDSGKSNKLVDRAGDVAVCAQLTKLGIATLPLADKISVLDVVAVDMNLNCISIQVKATQGPNWLTGDIGKYADISEVGSKLILESVNQSPYPNSIMVFVLFGNEGGPDRFFVLTSQDFYDCVFRSFKEWIESHGGVRPRNPRSKHSAISPKDLEPFEGNWKLIEDRFKKLQSLK